MALNIKNYGFNKILICGDFNFPQIEWDLMSSTDVSSVKFCDVLDQFSLEQVNKFPSRRHNNNVLDLVITNKPDMVTNIEC